MQTIKNLMEEEKVDKTIRERIYRQQMTNAHKLQCNAKTKKQKHHIVKLLHKFQHPKHHKY